MKYFFSTISILALMLFAVPVHAQTNCSAINNDADFESCCTSLANTSSACRDYATTWVQKNDPDNPQCYSVGYNNQDQCCSSGSKSPMCYLYGAKTTPVAGQINSGTPSTSAVNGGSNTNYGSTPQINSATQTDQKALSTCTAIQFTNLFNIALWVKCLIGVIVVPGIFTLAFLVFLWGVLKFMRSSEQKDKQDAKQYIYMGLIGLFVMVGVWGIINIVNTTFGIKTVVPTLQTSSLTAPSSSSTSTTTPANPTPAQPVSNGSFTTN